MQWVNLYKSRIVLQNNTQKIRQIYLLGYLEFYPRLRHLFPYLCHLKKANYGSVLQCNIELINAEELPEVKYDLPIHTGRQLWCCWCRIVCLLQGNLGHTILLECPFRLVFFLVLGGG